MVRDIREVQYVYKDQPVCAQMPGWYCPECGEGIHTGEDMKTSDRALNQLKARIDHLLEAKEIRRIRRKLGLTQAAAGQIIGGGPKAFSKYEKGDLLPSRAVVSALRLLDQRPEGLTVLLDGVEVLPKTKGTAGRQKARAAGATA